MADMRPVICFNESASPVILSDSDCTYIIVIVNSPSDVEEVSRDHAYLDAQNRFWVWNHAGTELIQLNIDWSGDIASLRAAIVDLQNQINNLQTALDDTNADLQTAITNFNQAIANLQNQINNLQGSLGEYALKTDLVQRAYIDRTDYDVSTIAFPQEPDFCSAYVTEDVVFEWFNIATDGNGIMWKYDNGKKYLLIVYTAGFQIGGAAWDSDISTTEPYVKNLIDLTDRVSQAELQVVQDQVTELATALEQHKVSGDHDDRYYTQDEIDNIVAGIVSSIVWKPQVQTFADLATTYPNPEEGWTVYVASEDSAYQWDGTQWISIFEIVLEVVTATNDGLMTSAMLAQLDQNTSDILTKAPINHASVTTQYGVGSGTSFGHLCLSNSVNGSSVGVGNGIAATPKAVYDALQLALNAAASAYTAGDNIQISGTNVISATDTRYTAGTNVQISSGNVISATDTDTKYTAGANVQISSSNVISATDTNTTYSAGTGLTLSGTTFNHSNAVNSGNGGPTGNVTVPNGGSFTVPYFGYDAQGHINNRVNRTVTLDIDVPGSYVYVTGTSWTPASISPAMAVGESRPILMSGTAVTSIISGRTIAHTGVITQSTAGVYFMELHICAINNAVPGIILRWAADTGFTQAVEVLPGTGLTMTNNTINHSNSVIANSAGPTGNVTVSNGDSFTVPYITYDAQGHVTTRTNRNVTLNIDVGVRSITAGSGIAISGSGGNLTISSTIPNAEVSVMDNGNGNYTISMEGPLPEVGDEYNLGGIDWIVIGVTESNRRVELFSKKALTTYMFNGPTEYTWSGSLIRAHLRSTFYQSLPSDFRSKIVTVSKSTDRAFNDTTQVVTSETVYLLSLPELTAAFPDPMAAGRLCEFYDVNGNVIASVPTGAQYYALDGTSSTATPPRYWLRSPAQDEHKVNTIVSQTGSAVASTDMPANLHIRPALTIAW